MKAVHEVLKIIKPGSLATIQDAGRPGLRRYGIPPSGAMDQSSYAVANRLVGNSAGAASIEIALGGFVAEAITSLTVAIGGGNLDPHLNEKSVPMWTAFAIAAGDRLTFPRRISGCRAYLAIRGGFHALTFLESKSVFSKGRMGRALLAGDILSIERELPVLQRSAQNCDEALKLNFSPPHRIRVILGPQTDYFTPRGIDTFLNSEYRLSSNSDRQGLRTSGPAIEFANSPDIISDPTPLGAIQVPGDGQPIVLHRDGQVTGGYPKIAVVASADLDRFAQMFPGDVLQFEAISRESAIELVRQC
ncbi:MAG: biotin-dependent carboxyltransferase [Pirellulales bacterium]|nr:biotin-dependent carboxyltransferase [Pirellulales bacterium]